MHMPSWEQLRSFLTWKTKWWRACKCFLQLQEHKWGTYKKSLSSSLQNPFRSQLSQREHQFSVWRATVNHTLPAETDWRLFHHFCPLRQGWGHCPLPGRCLCPPSLRVAGAYLQDVSLQYSEEGNGQLLSLRNNECKRFRLKKTTDTEMSTTFSLKATQCQLSPCSGSCLSCNMGTLHYTAQQWQHRPLELRKGSQGLILPMLFWWVTRTSATSHCWRSHSSSLPLLQGYAKEKMTM